MATSQHTPSRRAVLGAPLALAVIGTAAAQCVAQPVEARASATFARRLAGYRQAVADYNAYWTRYVLPTNDQHNAMIARFGRDSEQSHRAFAVVREAERGFDRLVDRAVRRIDLMLYTPAPDHAALADKIGSMIADEAWNRSDCDDLFQIILADVRRLGGEARS